MEYYKDVRDQNGGHVDPNIFRTNPACDVGSQTDPKDDQKSTREEFIIHSIITLMSIPLYILMLLSIVRCRLYVIDILKNEPKRKLRDLDTLNPPYDIKIRSAIQIKQLMKEMNTVETEQETL